MGVSCRSFPLLSGADYTIAKQNAVGASVAEGHRRSERSVADIPFKYEASLLISVWDLMKSAR